jgi:hypothetical protein
MMIHLGVRYDPMGALSYMLGPQTQHAFGLKLNQHQSIIPMRNDLHEHVQMTNAPANGQPRNDAAWNALIHAVQNPGANPQPGRVSPDASPVRAALEHAQNGYANFGTVALPQQTGDQVTPLIASALNVFGGR